jgi:prophage antirepressor-like protein
MCVQNEIVFFHSKGKTVIIRMSDIVDPNCIIKAFEKTEIAILNQVDDDDKPKYLFRATDVGKALEILNIYRTIQNFLCPKEKNNKKCDTQGGPHDVVFLTSKGLYRLLYVSRKPVAERFRDWVGDLLDDIVFNQAREIRVQLEQYSQKVSQLEQQNNELTNTLQKEIIERERAFTQCFNKRPVVYLGNVSETIVKFGVSDDIKTRIKDHKRTFPNFRLAWVIECKENRRLEKAIKSHAMLNNHRTTMVVNSVTHNELIELKLGLTFEDIVNTIVKLQAELVQDDSKTELLLKELEIRREKELKELNMKHEQTMKMLEIYSANPHSDLLNVLNQLRPMDNNTYAMSVHNEPSFSLDTTKTDPNSPSIIPPSTKFPLPTIPPKIYNINEFYHLWATQLKRQFDEHVSRFRRPQWAKCFGKPDASAHKLRYEKCYNWFNYMDSLTQEQSDLVLQIMTKFADTHGLAHSSLVKHVFYLMVRPDSLKPPGMDKLCEDLLAELKKLNIDLPPTVVKQVHNYKCVNQSNETNENE